jgi:hypothetical protein
MKRITIEYDEATSNMGVRAEGFTDAEVLVILKEAHGKASQKVIEELKKKKVAIVSPFAMNGIPKA